MDWTPSLDTWTSLFLIVAAQGLFLAGLLIVRPKGNRCSGLLLGAYLLAFSLTLIDYVGFWSGYHYYAPYLMGIYAPLVFLFGPLLYLYLRQILSNQSFSAREVWHFLPFLLFLGWRMPFFLLPLSQKREIIVRFHQNMYEQTPDLFSWSNLMGIVFLTHLTLYGFLCVQWVRRRIRCLSPGNRQWIRWLVWLFFGFVGSYYLYYVLANTPYFGLFQDYGIAAAMSWCVYAIGYLGYNHPKVLSGEDSPATDHQAPKYQHSSLTPGASQSLTERLLAYMETEKPYLDNELRLQVLADGLDVSSHHLSQVINEQLGKRFSEFVNDYRVREVQQMLRDPDKEDLLISDIAFFAGFNNKTSFYQAFKAQTGCSPSEYRRQTSRGA